GRSEEGLVAAEGPAEPVVGFLTFSVDTDAAEITWMAVDPGRRRAGVGAALIAALVDRLAHEGVRRLIVKTLSSREPYEPYAETRAFYRSMGFIEERELDIWGPANLAVLLGREV